jgi:hypothetical protein
MGAALFAVPSQAPARLHDRLTRRDLQCRVGAALTFRLTDDEPILCRSIANQSITQDEGGAVAARQHHVTTITDAGEGRPRNATQTGVLSGAGPERLLGDVKDASLRPPRGPPRPGPRAGVLGDVRARRSTRCGSTATSDPELACSATSRTRRFTRAAQRGLRPSLTSPVRAGGSQLRRGGSHPVTGRQALHREADDLLRSQLDAKGELEGCETRFRFRVAFERRATRSCSTSAACSGGACRRERRACGSLHRKFRWCSPPREVVTSYAAINRGRGPGRWERKRAVRRVHARLQRRQLPALAIVQARHLETAVCR